MMTVIVGDKTKSFVKMAAGIRRKTLAVGEKSLMAKFELEEGAVIPSHAHPHEQIGYLLSGQLLFVIGGVEFSAEAGDSWAIPGGVEHSVRVIQQAEALETFVPIREDYR